MGISTPIIALLVTCCVIAITLYLLHMMLCGVTLVLVRPEFTFLFGNIHTYSNGKYDISLEFINAGSIGISGFNITVIDKLTKSVIIKIGPILFNRTLSPGTSVSCSFHIDSVDDVVRVDCSIPVNTHKINWSPKPPGTVTSGRTYDLIVQVYAQNGIVTAREVTLFARG